MSDPSNPNARRPATIGVYAAPVWWKTRRFWRLALPVLAALVSLVVWFAILA